MIKTETGAKKVDIVAHSMGGLVARYYIQKSGTGDVGKLIMIGTPNHGSDWANLPAGILKTYLMMALSGNPILKKVGLDILVDNIFANLKFEAWELSTHSTFLKELNNNNKCAYAIENEVNYEDEISKSCRYSVIMSECVVPTLTHIHKFGVKVPSITKGDFVVPFNSAKLSDVSISSEGNMFHWAQLESPEIINKVSLLLRQPDELIQHDSNLYEDVELAPDLITTYWTNPIEDIIYQGEAKSYNTTIDSESKAADFLIVWGNGSLNVTLIAPNRTEIEIPSEENYAYYSVQSPDPGNWTAEILPISIPANGTIVFNTTNLTDHARIWGSTFVQKKDSLPSHKNCH